MKKYLKIAMLVCLATSLASCITGRDTSERKVRKKPYSAHGYFCQKEGYEPGTEAFNECIQRRIAAKERKRAELEELRRERAQKRKAWEEERQQQAEREKIQQEKRREQRAEQERIRREAEERRRARILKKKKYYEQQQRQRGS